MENIQKRIVDLIKQIKPNHQVDFDEHTDLFEVGILDSFGMIEFIDGLERVFSIMIPNEDLIPQNLSTLAAVKETVQKYM